MGSKAEPCTMAPAAPLLESIGGYERKTGAGPRRLHLQYLAVSPIMAARSPMQSINMVHSTESKTAEQIPSGQPSE